ncbi:MAG: ribosome-associated translation inhibitor RaiA [Candidatus Marinimicrobia bacterium]|nr:ribosome-associated translation inhibitor RaiA [Candidatus Neomarinimicrobiota bacterium]
MKIEITARHIDLSDNLKEYIEIEMGRLSKIYDRIIDAQVILEVEAHSQHGVEIIVNVPKKQLVIKQKADEETKAIDEAIGKMVRQLKKYKEKLRQ